MTILLGTRNKVFYTVTMLKKILAVGEKLNPKINMGLKVAVSVPLPR